MQAQIVIAERLIDQARVRDGNEAVISQDHTPDWISARSGARGVYNNYGNRCGYGYYSMAWPR